MAAEGSSRAATRHALSEALDAGGTSPAPGPRVHPQDLPGVPEELVQVDDAVRHRVGTGEHPAPLDVHLAPGHPADGLPGLGLRRRHPALALTPLVGVGLVVIMLGAKSSTRAAKSRRA